jgi:hypothetical protein
MNKTVAIILTLVSVLLCGCPGIVMFFSLIYSFFVSPDQAFNAVGVVPPSGDLAPYIWGSRVLMLVITLVLVLIPIVVGLLTLRRKKQTV